MHDLSSEDLLYQTSSVPTQHLPLSHSIVLARRPQDEMVSYTQDEIASGIQKFCGVYHLIGELNDECIFKGQVAGGVLSMSAVACFMKLVYMFHVSGTARSMS